MSSVFSVIFTLCKVIPRAGLDPLAGRTFETPALGCPEDSGDRWNVTVLYLFMFCPIERMTK